MKQEKTQGVLHHFKHYFFALMYVLNVAYMVSPVFDGSPIGIEKLMQPITTLHLLGLAIYRVGAIIGFGITVVYLLKGFL